MLRMKDCHPLDEIFSHVDEEGVERHFNATKMREWALLHLNNVELLTVPIDPSYISFIVHARGVEDGKINRMREPYLSQPVLGVHFPDGSTLTVDGHHRLVKRFMLGMPLYDIIRFPLGTWERFLVHMTPQDAIEWALEHKDFRP